MLHLSMRVASADPANCGAGAMLGAGARGENAFVQLTAPPVTSIDRMRRGELAAPMLTGGLRFTPVPGWTVRTDATVGPARPQCAFFSEQSRGWIGLTRGSMRTALTLSYGTRSLSALDPSRDREGITIALARRVSRGYVALEARRRSVKERSWRYFRVPITPNPVGVDSPFVSRDTSTTRPDSSSDDTGRVAFDARTRIGARFGRLSLALVLGGTPRAGIATPATTRVPGADTVRGSGARSAVQWWGRADATFTLSRHVVLNAAMISLPGVSDRTIVATGARQVASFGVALTGMPSFRLPRRSPTAASRDSGDGSARLFDESFRAVRIDARTLTFRARIPGATRVELASELTNWRSVHMQRDGDGWWSVALAGEPGTYRVNLRVNGGAWRPPAGVPVADDEFNGRVGIVSIDAPVGSFGKPGT